MYARLVLSALWLLSWCPPPVLTHSEHAKLLLISFDGFRHDYLEKTKASGRETPNFDRLISFGVTARVVNTFVTKTLPNHYSIVTGMFEENHGVVGNTMYDPKLNISFTNTHEEAAQSRWWNNGKEDGSWKGNPIWNLNQDAGEGSLFPRRSGVYYWPGSEAAVHSQHPFHYKRYPKWTNTSNPLTDTPFRTRAEAVIDWFIDDDNPINLGLIYFEQPDHIGHEVGPNSELMYDMIAELDGDIGNLINLMENNHLFKTINIIITSDHGMAQINNFVYLEDYNISFSQFDYYGSVPVLNILPKPGFEDSVFKSFSQIPHLKVYKKDDIPNEYHYKNNRRVLDILVAAEEGYNICLERSSCSGNGTHGYNNSLLEMNPIFIAHGPAFKKGLKHEPFSIVDIYPLICEVLGMEPAGHDGNLDNVRDMIAHHDNTIITLLTYVLCMAFAATVAGLFTVAALRIQRRHRRKVIHVFDPHGREINSPLLESGEEEEEEDEIP